ncbi:hypothetical protein ACFHYQ_01095 [Sphaerimonospora cavernae]|uniref:Uncharacterized protein n=1 Tax=Sphaerimonospora cavernae TaxID=1740611 RepID=A0ABV6TXE3_9ACTN
MADVISARSGGHLDLLLGAGPADDAAVSSWLTAARAVLHPETGPA